jgi:predicted  nucleic acid-binding Zn-ribbon protein
MGEMPRSSRDHRAVVAAVRCLECGAVYAKPAGGGTVHSNPGCPECGYLGWMAVRTRPEEEGTAAERGRRAQTEPSGLPPSRIRTARSR